MSENSAWQPDWATHPGEHLEEYLEVRGLSQAEFARLAGMTPKLVSTIIKGANPVSPETAIKLEHVLGLKADIWLGLQKDWDLHAARRRENKEAASAWLEQFPVRELKRIGRLPDVRDAGVLVDGLLDLLGIGAPEAFGARIDALAVHHRRSRRGETSRAHEICWLMLGEEQARRLDLRPFDKGSFVEACQEIRKLTVEEPESFEPKLKRICADAGVAFVLQKPISKTCLFGSARWVDGERPLIQMSLRMKSNDHFWWTFFHEAAHIVLHKGKNFADDQNAEGDGVEEQADRWAEEMLVGSARIEAFAASKPRSKVEVRAFAQEIGLHPGIVVGMLQHRKVIPHHFMHDLKDRFEWADEIAA
jgi:HTH-type transcriptional regulator/antitoxin HigA